jgi:succinate dehydrogenase / fumarate reductase flavoprotein subunit
MTKIIDSKIPEGPIAEKWTNYKAHQKLVNPANKRRLDIIVVGTGLAGASAAAPCVFDDRLLRPSGRSGRGGQA